MFSDFIWDFDGTLFDTYPVMAKAFHSALLDFGRDDTYDELITRLKISSVATMEHYRAKYGLGEDFVHSYRDYSQKYEDEITPFDGAYDICRLIWEKGLKNYIYTHRGLSTVKYMERDGLAPFFTEYVTSDNGLLRKPDPEGIVYLLDRYAIPKESAVMIGDREVDMESAKNAGITACFFRGTHADSRAADIKIDSLREIEGLI